MSAHPPAPAAQHSPAAAAPHRREWSTRLLLESVLIVVSVLLGLALNEWRQARADRALARTVVANFRREIGQNLATLEAVHPAHALFAARLAAAASQRRPEANAFDVFVAEMPAGGLGGEPLREAAWETATTTGALRLLNYETASRISEVYVLQRVSIGPTLQRTLDRLLAPENFEPASKQVMVRTQHMLMNELSGQEAYLIGVYRRALEALPPE